MRKILILTTIILLGILAVSCEKEPRNQDTRARGATIHNLPAWLQEGWGYASEWQDWQGESGILLHDFVPDSMIPDSFEGKFRLYIRYEIQDISIGFNDIDGTTYCLFYNWYDSFPRGTTNSHVSIPQSDPDTEFSFDCYAKNRLDEDANPSNQSHVSFIKDNRPGSKFTCRYVQTIAGKEIINTEIFPVNLFTFSKRNWLPLDVINQDNGDVVLNFTNDSILQHYSGMPMVLNGENYQRHMILSAEGMTVKSCDDSQQMISFNLLDGSLGGFADYFTFKRTGNTGVLSYYKIVNEVPVLIKSYENLICKDTY